jgi:hypothetical protein
LSLIFFSLASCLFHSTNNLCLFFFVCVCVCVLCMCVCVFVCVLNIWLHESVRCNGINNCVHRLSRGFVAGLYVFCY